MFINEINSLCSYKSNYINFNKKQEENKKDKTKERILATTGVIAASVISGVLLHRLHIASKKPPRLSFNELLDKNNLEFKNNILIVKDTDKTFTGELKRSTGEFLQNKLSEKIEIQKFENGIIREKIFTNSKGEEAKGYFYKGGKLRLEVFSVIENNKKRFGFYDYGKQGNGFVLGDGLLDKNESLFEWARKYIKKLN